MLIRQNIFFKEGNECIYAIEIYYMHIYFTLIFLFWSYYNPWSDREQAYQTLVNSVPNISKTILSHGFKYDLCKTYSTNSIKKSVYKIGISVLSVRTMLYGYAYIKFPMNGGNLPVGSNTTYNHCYLRQTKHMGLSDHCKNYKKV